MSHRDPEGRTKLIFFSEIRMRQGQPRFIIDKQEEMGNIFALRKMSERMPWFRVVLDIASTNPMSSFAPT